MKKLITLKKAIRKMEEGRKFKSVNWKDTTKYIFINRGQVFYQGLYQEWPMKIDMIMFFLDRKEKIWKEVK